MERAGVISITHYQSTHNKLYSQIGGKKLKGFENLFKKILKI